MTSHEVFQLGDVVLQSGLKLRNAELAFKTYGALNSVKDNAIVFPTFFSGKHTDNEPMIGEGMALDPARYFIIVPNLFGNGLSSSPSNTPPPYDRARFPLITYYDNIAGQHRLVTEKFGIERIALVCGFSMGAQQSFHWGALFPDMVERIAPWCGSARTSGHNFVFLEGVKAALRADAAWQDGWYDQPPAKGIRAMARVYAGWGPSQALAAAPVSRSRRTTPRTPAVGSPLRAQPRGPRQYHRHSPRDTSRAARWTARCPPIPPDERPRSRPQREG